MTSSAEPWLTYDRERLPAGWSYPLGRSVIEATLREAGVQLLSLDLRSGRDHDAGIVLLHAVRYRNLGNDGGYFRARGTPDAPRGVLMLHAVPSGVRARASDALTSANAVEAVSAWLAAAEQAPPTWLDQEHHWTALLRRDQLIIEDD